MIKKRRKPGWEQIILGFLITCTIILGMLCRVIIQRSLALVTSRTVRKVK
jgi:hypothetical protein